MRKLKKGEEIWLVDDAKEILNSKGKAVNISILKVVVDSEDTSKSVKGGDRYYWVKNVLTGVRVGSFQERLLFRSRRKAIKHAVFLAEFKRRLSEALSWIK